MIIAVSSQGPDLEALVDPRFGRARYFLVVDCATGQQTVVDNEAGVQAAQGARSLWPHGQGGGQRLYGWKPFADGRRQRPRALA
jgi:hypothetical protein